MKKTLFLLSCAAGLTLASCSENKTADTATTTSADGTTTTTTTTTTSYSDDAIQRRADRMAADMATKMKFDDATREKIRTVYINRGKRIGELQQKYATDTTGMAAAMRDAYSSTDAEFKTILTDPTQYSAYESSRTEYMDDRYMDDNTMSSSSADMDTSSMSSSADMSTTTTTTDMSTSTGTASSGMGVSKMKAKAEDGSKIKVKDNGKVKTKDADGEKSKM